MNLQINFTDNFKFYLTTNSQQQQHSTPSLNIVQVSSYFSVKKLIVLFFNHKKQEVISLLYKIL